MESRRRMKLLGCCLALGFPLFMSCGGCSSSDDGGSSNGGTGVFLDSAVEGITYTSGTLTGLTDAQGTFHWEGNSVTFTIGEIVIGTTVPQTHLTPVDIVNGASDETDPAVTNIARFLLTMDNDGDPSNGITITASLRDAAEILSVNFGVSIAEFENSQNVQDVVSQLTGLTTAGARGLVSTQAAQEHLRETLQSLIPPDPTSCSSGERLVRFEFTPDIGEPFPVTRCATFYTILEDTPCNLVIYVFPGDFTNEDDPSKSDERFFNYSTPYGSCFSFGARIKHGSIAYGLSGYPQREFDTDTGGPYAVGDYSVYDSGEHLGTFQFFEKE